MSLPSPNPALPSYPAPYFLDNSFVRGDQQRANNGFIWNNLEDLDTRITTLETVVSKSAIDYSKFLGEVFFLPENRLPSFTFDPLNPRNYFPAVSLTAINGDYTDCVSVSAGGNFPNAWVNYMLSINIGYLVGISGSVTNWGCTVSGADVTFPNTVSANAVLAALAEDAEVNAGVYNRRLRVVGDSSGVSRLITGINLVTRVVTLFNSPTVSGSQTVTIPAYEADISTGRCRIFAIKGEAIMAPNDPDGYFIMNLRTRGYFQGHYHQVYTQGAFDAGAGQGVGPSVNNNIGGDGTAVRQAITDGTNGTPLTRKITHGPAYTLIPYMWCGG